MPTHVHSPDGTGPWPVVIVYMDAVGIRPAMQEIAETIASHGYLVLLPDLFYRVEWDSKNGLKLFTDPEFRKDLFSRVMPSASHANVMRDTEALLAWTAEQPDADADHLGITGYCMGGRIALYAAGHFGDGVQAVASYHAGNVATDAPDSPHKLAPNIRARVYVAGAIEDAGFDKAQKERLEQALTDASVDHLVETYNARHGFVPKDTPVHDAAAEAKHWQTLFALFDDRLKAHVARSVDHRPLHLFFSP